MIERGGFEGVDSNLEERPTKSLPSIRSQRLVKAVRSERDGIAGGGEEGVCKMDVCGLAGKKVKKDGGAGSKEAPGKRRSRSRRLQGTSSWNSTAPGNHQAHLPGRRPQATGAAAACT